MEHKKKMKFNLQSITSPSFSTEFDNEELLNEHIEL